MRRVDMIEEIDKTYVQIENKILNHEIYQSVKDYSKAKEKMKTYLEVGSLLKNVDTKYGKNVIKDYSKRLTIKFGKKYSTSLLYKIKQFYSIIEKVPTMSGELTWSHWYEMLSFDDISKIVYYVNQCEAYNLDVRELRNRIKSNEYERLPVDTRNKLKSKDEANVMDFVKNPIHIKNSENKENISEKILQKLVLEDIPSFLEELGEGFTFIKNEYKIKIDDRYNYIDLLLYNIKYKCYVVVELKVAELKKEHTGQIMIYINYIDINLKTIEENDTVGIIICKQDNEYVIKYCSDDRIIAREYELDYYKKCAIIIINLFLGVINMNENKLYSVSYDDMKRIIKNYYAQQGRNVDLRISNEIDTDRFAGMVTTSIQMTEKSTIGGIESKSHRYLDMNDLKEIVGNVLEQEGKELLDLTNNAVSSSRIEGYGMGEHEVKSITGKSFTITAREKKQTLGR